MKFKQPILLFTLSLSSMAVWKIMYDKFGFPSPNIMTLLILASIGSMIFFATKFVNNFSFGNKYFKWVFTLLFIYQLINVVRGWTFEYLIFKNEILQTDYIFWPFLIPVFVFFDKTTDNLAELCKSFFYLGIGFLVIGAAQPGILLSRQTAESFIHTFGFGCAFLLMNAKYLSKFKFAFSLLVTTIVLLAMIYLARRNVILTYGSFFLVAIYLYFKRFSFEKWMKIFPLIAALLIVMLLGIDKVPASLTQKLSSRLTEDTRSGVFDALFTELEDDMALGLGMNGKYYCPNEYTETDDGAIFNEIEFRNVIENGYYQFLLNGGYVYITLFVLTLLPAGLLGVFKSKNNFSRACGFIILLWMVDMFVYGMPRLVIQYIFVWISVGICYSKTIRMKPDEEFKAAFQKVGLG